MKKSNIVLIGMPGAGKSTVGVILAKAAGLQFCDTDLIIQQKTGRKLQDIINNDGIEKFLETESDVLSLLSVENSVIATGGSAVYSEAAMQNLKRTGIAVWLDVPLCEVKRRIDNITTRGIVMHPGESLDSIYAERLPLYRKYADITVSCSSTEETVENILKSIQPEL